MTEGKRVQEHIRYWLQWLEDTAASVDSSILKAVKSQDCYLLSYAEPKGVIEHERELAQNEDWYMGIRLNFADFDLKTVFMNEAGVRFDNDENKMTDRVFVGNISNAEAVLQTYEGLEATFIVPDETLNSQELNNFHYLATALAYALAKKNGFEVAPIEWDTRDSEVLYKIIEAVLLILMYQPLTTCLIFISTLSNGLRSVLLNYAIAASSNEVEMGKELDPSIKVAAQVLASRNQLLEDSFAYLFEGDYADREEE